MNNKKMYNLFLISLVFLVYFLVTLGLYVFQRNLLYHPMENNYSGDELTVKIEKVKKDDAKKKHLKAQLTAITCES